MKLNLYVPTPKRIMWDCEVIEIILSTNSGQIGVLLKMMAYGGNSRAHAFFKQHGWSDGSSKVEANYTSRAAELYRQILTKEVAKSSPADNALLSSPVVASKQPNSSNDFPEFKLSEPPHNSNGKQEHNSLKAPTCSPKAPTHPTFVSSVKKPILDGKKVGGKTGGLGVRKLTTKVMPLMEGFPYYCSYWFPDS
jgi:ADP-ribosylation factor GTPase-activating protein 2/3